MIRSSFDHNLTGWQVIMCTKMEHKYLDDTYSSSDCSLQDMSVNLTDNLINQYTKYHLRTVALELQNLQKTVSSISQILCN